MIQRSDGFSLAFEAVGELARGDLDSNVAIQARITGSVDLAHAAGPDRTEDLIRAKF
jgi:hypothetical protein